MDITYTQLFIVFLKLGAFTFGGGYAMIPVIERELVHKSKLIDSDAFYDSIVICQSLPGIIAVNMAVLLGSKLKGAKGAFLSVLGVTLPSFIIILMLATVFFQVIENPYVLAFFKGVRVSVVALIFMAGIRILKRDFNGFTVFVATLTFALVAYLFMHPFIVILLMGFFGYITTQISKRGDIT